MLGTYYDQTNSKHRILLSNGRKHTKTMVSEAIGVYIEVSGQLWCHFPSINAKYIFASRHPFLTFDTPYPAHYVGPTIREYYTMFGIGMVMVDAQHRYV